MYKKYEGVHGEAWSYDIWIKDENSKRVRRRKSGFLTKEKARQAVLRLKGAELDREYGLEPPVPVKHTLIGEAVEAYLKVRKEEMEVRENAKYVQRNIGQLNVLSRWAEFAGRNRRVSEITRDDLVSWMNKEAQRGLKISSVSRGLNTIRACLRHARQNNQDLVNYPIPEKPLGKSADIMRMRILSDEEIIALSGILSSRADWRDAYDFFRVALGSGGRFGEIMGLKWIDVNRSFMSAYLFSKKTGKGRTLAIPAVAEVLVQRKKDGLGSETHAFTCRDHWLRKVYGEASKMAGIIYGQQVEGGWTVHDLRHTCLTDLLQAGVDLATVRDFAGHESIAQTCRYVHPTEKSKALLAATSSQLVQLATHSVINPNVA